MHKSVCVCVVLLTSDTVAQLHVRTLKLTFVFAGHVIISLNGSESVFTFMFKPVYVFCVLSHFHTDMYSMSVRVCQLAALSLF